MSDPSVTEDASSVITLDQSQTMNDIGFETTPGCSFARNHRHSQSSNNDAIKETNKALYTNS